MGSDRCRALHGMASAVAVGMVCRSGGEKDGRRAARFLPLRLPATSYRLVGRDRSSDRLTGIKRPRRPCADRLASTTTRAKRAAVTVFTHARSHSRCWWYRKSAADDYCGVS